MLVRMNDVDLEILDSNVIDITPQPVRRRGRVKWFAIATLFIVAALWNSVSVYTESLWFDSLGFGSRYWYVFGVGWVCLGRLHR